MAGRRWVRRRISNTTIKLKWKDEVGGTTAAQHDNQIEIKGHNNLPSAANPGKGVQGTRANAGSSMYPRIQGRTRNGFKVRHGATQ